MTADFNPYYEWLGLDRAISQPDHYQLLGVSRRERDPRRIRAAADRALARVRAKRPGSQAVAWSRLLDEIAAARQCLTEPAERRRYDGHIAGGPSPMGVSAVAQQQLADDPNRFPPGHGEPTRCSAAPPAPTPTPMPHDAPSDEAHADDAVPFPSAPPSMRTAEPSEPFASLSEFAELVDQTPIESLADVARVLRGPSAGSDGNGARPLPPGDDSSASMNGGDAAPNELREPSSSPRVASDCGSRHVAEETVRASSFAPLIIGVVVGFGLLALAACAAYLNARSAQPTRAPAKNPLTVLSSRADDQGDQGADVGRVPTQRATGRASRTVAP